MEEIVKVFGIKWELVLIQAVNFGLLLLILWWFLYRPLVSIISKRQQVIEQGVANAKKAESRVKEIEEEKDSIILNATTEGGLIIDKAKESASVKESEIISEANDKSSRILESANAKSEEIKKRALEESKGEITRMAVLAAEKILREKAESR